MASSDPERILAHVFGTFAGKPKRPRAKPHRCLECGKVTRHVKCHDCSGANRCTVCNWTREA